MSLKALETTGKPQATTKQILTFNNMALTH